MNFELPASLANEPEISDADLMAALQRGDTTALEYLYRKYQNLLKAVIFRVTHDHAAADDVMQECLVELWKSGSHYSREKGEPLAWLTTMCKRRAIDYVRRTTAYNKACDRLETQVRYLPFEAHEDHACESSDVANLLEKKLSHLPEKQREAVYLAFVEGMSQREVARATKTPLGTVKTRIELGLKKLRTSLASAGDLQTA